VIDSRYKLVGALLLASWLAHAPASFPSVSLTQRQLAAVEAFNKAQRLRTTLESQPENLRSRNSYKKVINAYFDVYRLNPAYSKTPLAFTAFAELYEKMGRVFSSDSYYLESIKTYRFMMKEYPQNRLSRDALFTVGEIYRRDLGDRADARKAFQNFIQLYPKSDKLDEARDKLRQIDQPSEERTRVRLAPPKKGPEAAEGLLEVSAVRNWVGPNYSRIVIGVEGEVEFNTVRLSNPDRIVLDLQNSRLSPGLVGKTFPAEDGFLRQIRVAQFAAGVTRIVLDVQKIEDYSVFSLPNPFRLVIDVHGGSPPVAAKSDRPAVPPMPENRKTEMTSGPAIPLAPAPGARAESTAQYQPPGYAKPQPRTSNPDSAQARSGEKTVASIVPPIPPGPKKKPRSGTESSASPPEPAIQPAGPTASGSRTLTRALGLKIGRIVIDPGHGGHDTGTIGPTGLEEKTVVLDVGLRLKKLLERSTSCDVIMTRDDDTFIPLEERTAIANEKGADLFISIHANASRDMSARGIETYYLNLSSNPDVLEVAARENATSQESVHQLQDLIKKIAMTEKIEESEDFAKLVQREVYTRVTKVSGAQRDRGVKKAPFVVLIGANMPSVLAEISFLTNPRDEGMLKRPDYRERIAGALYDGILQYLRNLGEVKTAQRAASDQTSAARRPDF
jgi:N-acetylmuramoyl-L-alanine amidase